MPSRPGSAAAHGTKVFSAEEAGNEINKYKLSLFQRASFE
jgi:hypothetical protein